MRRSGTSVVSDKRDTQLQARIHIIINITQVVGARLHANSTVFQIPTAPRGPLSQVIFDYACRTIRLEFHWPCP